MNFEYIKLLIKIWVLRLRGYDYYDINLRLHLKTIEKLKRKYRVVEEGEGIRYHIVINWREERR